MLTIYIWIKPIGITHPLGSGSVNMSEMMESSNGDTPVIFYDQPIFSPSVIEYFRHYTSTGGSLIELRQTVDGL